MLGLVANLGIGPACAADATVATPATVDCLPDGSGYLHARLAGAIDADIEWGNHGTQCTGSTRPDGAGLRVVFKGPAPASEGDALVLLFGIGGIAEGESARAVPVNITIIREGTGEFYGTQGADRCYLDELEQSPLAGIPRRERAYRVVARGYCMQPARAVNGDGSVLVSRFDYAGRIDFQDSEDEPSATDGALANAAVSSVR